MGITTNISLVRHLLDMCTYDVVALVETWVPSVPTTLDCNGYYCLTLSALPRTGSKGRDSRGLLVFIKKHIRISSI